MCNTGTSSYAFAMEIYCAGCGCLVDRGVRVVPCHTTDCCCLGLPIQLRTLDQIADQINTAFATKNLNALGRLLADDARWGDDDHPNKCRSRSDVIATFDRLLGEGVDGEVTEAIHAPTPIGRPAQPTRRHRRRDAAAVDFIVEKRRGGVRSGHVHARPSTRDAAVRGHARRSPRGRYARFGIAVDRQ